MQSNASNCLHSTGLDAVRGSIERVHCEQLELLNQYESRTWLIEFTSWSCSQSGNELSSPINTECTAEMLETVAISDSSVLMVVLPSESLGVVSQAASRAVGKISAYRFRYANDAFPFSFASSTSVLLLS